jgi:LCP family protein required for cell wall assembly
MADSPVRTSTASDYRDMARPGGNWVGRHKAATGLVGLLLALFCVVVGFAVYLNAQIGKVPRIDAGITLPPAEATGESHRAVNILVTGIDARAPSALAAALRSRHGRWQPGLFRSDTLMFVHLTADRTRAYVISIPRDSFVAVPGYGMHKINAAFSYGGPRLAVKTVQRFTGLHIDHLAVVSWGGFTRLTDALGGVDVDVPRTVTDPSNQVTWHAGRQRLDGQRALLYVRQRYGLPGGDFDRIHRQQQYLKAMMSQLLSAGALTNPFKLTGVVHAVVTNLALDSTFTNGEVRGLALSVRKLRTDDVTFMTVPILGPDTVNGASVLRVDDVSKGQLFEAVDADDLTSYLVNHPST